MRGAALALCALGAHGQPASVANVGYRVVDDGPSIPAQWPRLIIGCKDLTERETRVEAVQTLQAYLDEGFTTFDTGDTFGESEACLGMFSNAVAASGTSRQPRMHTKYTPRNDETFETARRTVERSRDKMQQAPELVAFHWWDWRIGNFSAPLAHLFELQAQGAIGHVGVTNFDVAHLQVLVDAGVRVVSNQVQYSMIDRRPENGLLAFCRKHRIRVLAYGTMLGGWLTDRQLGAIMPPPVLNVQFGRTRSERQWKPLLDRWMAPAKQRWPLYQKLIATLVEIGDKHATSAANVAVAWVQHRLASELGDVGGSVLIGVRDAEHLEDHKKLASGFLELDEDDMEAINLVLIKGKPPNGDVYSYERRLKPY